MSPKQYPVIDAKSAIKNHNKQLEGMKVIEARMNPIDINKSEPVEQGDTLEDFLAENSLPNTFSIKASLASKIGMSGYSGKPEQDRQILKAMTKINEKESESKGKENDDKYKEREFGLKEKELSIKEKEAENKKGPDADAIASSLMNKFNQQ